MAILKKDIKQPADRWDYDFDYSEWLLSSDTLESATVTVETSETIPSEDTLAIDGFAVLPKYVKVWVDKGIAGATYKITCTVTTRDGRIKQDEMRIRVRDY